MINNFVNEWERVLNMKNEVKQEIEIELNLNIILTKSNLKNIKKNGYMYFNQIKKENKNIIIKINPKIIVLTG